MQFAKRLAVPNFPKDRHAATDYVTGYLAKDDPYS